MQRRPSKLRFRNARFRRAFTLIELMVVVVLIGIMAAAIIPEMKGSFDEALLRSTGRDIINVCNLASSRAVGFNQCCRVKFDTQNGRYTVERQVRDGTGDDFVPLRDVSGAQGRVDPRIAVEIGPLDDETSKNDPGINRDDQPLTDAISFYSDGTADPLVIRLHDRAGFQLWLRVNPVTARIHLTETLPQ